MNKNILLLVFAFLISFSIKAQNETMYFMKNGIVINEQSVAPSAVDSVIFYKPEGYSEPLTDIDGNVYRTVKFGDQIWMAENLRVTRYPDGSNIPLFEDNASWKGLNDNNVDAGYCWYDNDIKNKPIYGGLYTYAAALKACPEGWHLPTDEDWKKLETEMGLPVDQLESSGYRGTGVYLGSKLAGQANLWNDGALETCSDAETVFGSSGFSAVPGGERNPVSGAFSRIGEYGIYWNNTFYSTGRVYCRDFFYNSAGVTRRGNLQSSGYSVRYVKD